MTSLKWNQIEHGQIKNVATEIKKTELGLNSRLESMKADLTKIQNRRNYVEIIHSFNKYFYCALCIYPF